MAALLDFVYLGEAKVDQEHLGSFLALAEHISPLLSAEAATAALELTVQQRIRMWRAALSVDPGDFVWNFKRFRQFVSQHGTQERQE